MRVNVFQGEQKNMKLIVWSIDVVKYLLILVDREAGDAITQLKLQKLMYTSLT